MRKIPARPTFKIQTFISMLAFVLPENVQLLKCSISGVCYAGDGYSNGSQSNVYNEEFSQLTNTSGAN